MQHEQQNLSETRLPITLLCFNQALTRIGFSWDMMRLELRAPVAYLQDITEWVRENAQATSDGGKKAKTGPQATGSSVEQGSDSFLLN
ncbi:MAG: hypothetical protein SF162_07945 [bacterium]|nr:hypothetical protein [bacterium]